ncbi:hypothetical protein ACWGJB_19185 [Streptomyces sp. NPDC054813]
MNLTLRTSAACALAVAAVATVLGSAQATTRTVAPAEHHTKVAAPGEEHDPKEDAELDENGRPDLNED